MLRRFPFLRYLFWVILALLLIVGVYWFYVAVVLRTPTEFTIATGREGGAYYIYANEYAAELEKIGLTLHVRPTAGSVATLELLNRGEVPVGFVQSGTATGVADPSLYALGSVFYEPIWVFYRRDVFPDDLPYLYQLAGKRVAIGEAGSGTNALARSMLDLNEVTDATATLVEAPTADAVTMLEQGDVDAAFFVLAPVSEVLPRLMADEELALKDFQRAKAYEAHFPFLSQFVIGEGTIDLRHNRPAQDVTILATTAMLVANQELHPDLARQLLSAAIEVNGNAGFFEETGEFPSAANTELPVPTSISTFLEVGPTGLEKFVPVQVAGLIERLFIYVLPIAVLLFPLLRSTPLAYRFANQYRIYRWYTRVRESERGIEQFTLQELNEEIDYLTELDQRLADGVRVPTFYQRDFYDLRMHLLLVLNRLQDRRDQLADGDTGHQVSDRAKRRVDADEATLDDVTI